MAEVDARIALGLQPVKINDPMETYAKGLQLKSLIDSGQLSKLQYDQAVKNAALDEGINNAYKNAYGADGAVDRNKLYAGVAQAGGGSKLPAIQKGFAEADKIGYESQVEKMKVAKQKTEQLGSLAGSALEMIKSGNINQVASVYGQAVNRGLMTAEEARQEMGQLNWGDPNSLMRHFGSVQMRAVDALKQIELNTPKIEYRNTGKQQVPVDINARTNPNRLPLNNTTTPDSDQSNARALQIAQMNDARARAGQAITLNGQSKAPPGYRYTADGNLEQIPGGPADIKAQTLANQKATGAADVETAITSLRSAYDRLEKGGGITSTNKGAMGNIGAFASSSGPGQLVGKALGTENQSARNDIAMTRPALLASLMKATGMSAKQMDSNAELKLWLATATDPTLDVESNRRALANIEKKYLGGSAALTKPEAAKPASATTSIPAGWAVKVK